MANIRIEGIEDVLNGVLSPRRNLRALVRTVNECARAALAEGKRALRARYNVKNKDIDGDIVAHASEKVGKLAAAIGARRLPLGLHHFVKGRAEKLHGPVLVEVLRGKTGVVKGGWFSAAHGKNWTRYGQSKAVYSEPRIWKRQGKKPYPIKSLIAMSPGAMLRTRVVNDRMQRRVNEIAQARLLHNIQRETGARLKSSGFSPVE